MATSYFVLRMLFLVELGRKLPKDSLSKVTEEDVLAIGLTILYLYVFNYMSSVIVFAEVGKFSTGSFFIKFLLSWSFGDEFCSESMILGRSLKFCTGSSV